MIRRSAHLRIGLDDPAMVLAPDYELWTRALRAGCRFGLVPEKLTYYRLQPRGVTFSDRVGTLREMSYAMIRNLVPHADARALLPSYERMVHWLARHPDLSAMRPVEAHRLVGMMMLTPSVESYATFRAILAAEDADSALALAGHRVLMLTAIGTQRQPVSEPPGSWRQQSEAWETAHATLVARLTNLLESLFTEEATS